MRSRAFATVSALSSMSSRTPRMGGNFLVPCVGWLVGASILTARLWPHTFWISNIPQNDTDKYVSLPPSRGRNPKTASADVNNAGWVICGMWWELYSLTRGPHPVAAYSRLQQVGIWVYAGCLFFEDGSIHIPTFWLLLYRVSNEPVQCYTVSGTPN